MNGLILHAGANAATLDAVQAVPTPEPTDSWQPIPHADLYRRVRETLEGNGLHVVQEAHGLWRDGARYFGLLEVRNGTNADDFSLIVGLRNSHDKSFPAALALGSRVFVCDNLAFSGEISLSRKHTRFICRDLAGLVQRGVARLADLRHFQGMRIERYKSATLIDERVVHDLAVKAVDARAIPATSIMDVLREWRQPRHEEFRPRTAWSFFNAATEILKGSLSLLPSRTQALHGLLDSHVGLLLPKPEPSDETFIAAAI